MCPLNMCVLFFLNFLYISYFFWSVLGYYNHLIQLNAMDKIWDRKSFEVGGHWPQRRGGRKGMTTQNRQKSNAKKNKNDRTLRILMSVC